MSKTVPSFHPELYRISRLSGSSDGRLEIDGQKSGAPNRRIILDQKGLRVTDAKIIYIQKNKQIEHQVIRINHLPYKQEVRLHTGSPLYPGSYHIEMTYSPVDLKAISELEGKSLAKINLRDLMPSFDTPEEKEDIKLEITT
jgi:hypothetical protein